MSLDVQTPGKMNFGNASGAGQSSSRKKDIKNSAMNPVLNPITYKGSYDCCIYNDN